MIKKVKEHVEEAKRDNDNVFEHLDIDKDGWLVDVAMGFIDTIFLYNLLQVKSHGLNLVYISSWQRATAWQKLLISPLKEFMMILPSHQKVCFIKLTPVKGFDFIVKRKVLLAVILTNPVEFLPHLVMMPTIQNLSALDAKFFQ